MKKSTFVNFIFLPLFSLVIAIIFFYAVSYSYIKIYNKIYNKILYNHSLSISEELERLSEQYLLNSNRDMLVAHLNVISELESPKLSRLLDKTNALSTLNKTHDEAMNRHDFELSDEIAKITQPFGYEAFDENEYAILAREYDGDKPYIHSRIAGWLLGKNRIKSAYNSYEKAAMYDNYYASTVRAFLRHYGCMQTDQVWAERSISYHGIATFTGGSYPPVTPTEGFNEQLPKLRKDFKFGIKPKLEEGCPINLYE